MGFSATSRRDTAEADEFAEEEAAIRREKDPRVAKRLSNTLAARRSRHRKAEELRLLHEKIEALSAELGLSDGGDGFEIGGFAIPREWDQNRTARY